MDNSNLLGGIPPTDGSVFAKNVKPTTPPGFVLPGQRLIRLWQWMITDQTGAGIAIFLVAIPTMLLVVGQFLYGLLLLSPLAYLSLGVAELEWPWFAWKLQQLFHRPEPVMPASYAEAVSLLQQSENPVEQNSILLGTVEGTNIPVLLPEKALMAHVQIEGPSDIGKTWKVEMSITDQLIRKGRYVIIFVDGKGDVAIAKFLEKKAKEAKLPYLFMSIEPHVPSMSMNPIDQSCFNTWEEWLDMTLQVCGHGDASTEYGKSFFNLMIEKRAKRQTAAFPDLLSYRAIRNAIDKLSTPELAAKTRLTAHELQLGIHFDAEVSRLAEIPCLNARGPSLDIMTVLKEPCVIYVSAPANVNKVSAAYVERFLLYIVNASKRKLGPGSPPVHVGIDEAQELMSVSQMPVFKTCRHLGVGVSIIHQNPQDFVNLEKNVLPMIQGNTRVGIHLATSDPMIRKYMKEVGGEMTGWMKSINQAKGEETSREVLVPRISTEDFDRVNSDPDLAFVNLTTMGGFAAFRHPFICRLLGFPCTEEDYERYRRSDWPEVECGATRKDLLAEDPPSDPTTKKVEAPRKARAAALLEAFAAMRAAH